MSQSRDESEKMSQRIDESEKRRDHRQAAWWVAKKK